MIRKTGYILILVTLLATGSLFRLAGQDFVPTAVEKSAEKVNISGKLHYAHMVLKGQTLYSISKTYNVSVETIMEHNPSLKDGLKSGILIYIPVENAIAEAPRIPRESTPAPAPIPEPEKKNYKKHTAKWYENIYDIAQKYSVPADALMAINKLGEEAVLSKRQVLLIPDKEYIAAYNRSKKGDLLSTPKAEMPAISVADTTNVTDTIGTMDENVSSEIDLSIYQQNIIRSYKITLLLPFNTAAGAENANVNQMDFYAGSMVAFNDFISRKGDSRYKLNIVDMNDYPSVFSLIVSGVLNGSEVIIGPVFEKNLAPLAEWADENHIPLVSPLDPKAHHLSQDHPFFFQFPPAQETLMATTYDGIAQEAKTNGSRPLVIYEKWTGKSRMVNDALNNLSTRGVEYDTLSYGILEGRGIDTTMVKMMDTTKVNTAFVVSESEAFVSDVLRNLHLAKGDNSKLAISLYGLPKWRNFEVVELSYLHELNTHLSLQYNIDYTHPDVERFIGEFRYHFKTDPNQYAFQGYDIMSYCLSLLDQYGRGFPAHINGEEKSLFQSNIRFEKADNGSGFTNKGVRNVLYSDNWVIKSWE
jgi:LysM repeat protein